MGASTGWRRHAVARYSSDTIKGAVSLSYCLHKSPDAASASALPPIVAMEGMFGLKENLTAVCRALAAKTGRNVFAVDMRNQGDSPHTEDMNYELTTADLELFLKKHGMSKATFVGHSLAGRMVMYFAVTKPSAVDRIVVVDTGLIPGPPVLFNKWLPWQASAMEHILSLLSPDMNMEQALQVGDQYLSAKVTDPFIRSVLLANLRKGPHSYEWRINIKALRKFLPVMADPHFLGNGHSDVDALFVAADESAYLRADDFKDIKRVFPNARLATVKGANHWVHNKTEEFVDLVRDFMSARRTEA
nr:protein ABHD11-like isoform X1 [Rhipicephalus microplus]